MPNAMKTTAEHIQGQHRGGTGHLRIDVTLLAPHSRHGHKTLRVRLGNIFRSWKWVEKQGGKKGRLIFTYKVMWP